jgi:hypothetical protein
MSKFFFFFYILFPCSFVFAQYDDSYVDTKSATIDGDVVNMILMNRKGGRVKAKYFASRVKGEMVYERYQKWAKNKQIIAYSSAGYSNSCDNPRIATPIGVCFDDGILVNQNIKDNMDGFVVINAKGEILLNNLKEDKLSFTSSITGELNYFNIRNSFDFSTFKNWASHEKAGVFQTHLFYYKDQIKVGTNGSGNLRERRILAACKDEDGNDIYCLINLPGNNTLYEVTKKASDYLLKNEHMKNIYFMINLHTGCENIFQANKPNGSLLTGDGWSGLTPINNASNLIVFYYE